jgi:glycine betaine/proline transport system permease protein
VFGNIEASRRFVWTFNWAAAIFGPLWAGARGLWPYFWLAAVAEVLASIEIARGWMGSARSEYLERAARLHEAAVQRLAEAHAAAALGDSVVAATFDRIARNLEAAERLAIEQAHAATAGARWAFGAGLALLLVVKLAEGLLANAAYERQYTMWRTDKQRVAAGVPAARGLLALLLALVVYPLTIFRFTTAHVPELLIRVPVGKTGFTVAAHVIDGLFDGLYHWGSGLFDAIRDSIRWVVQIFDTVLVGTPWAVVMTVIITLAWQIAGRRMAVVTAAVAAYLALLGMWQQAMQTVALLGTASLICVGLGIPLGIVFARSRRAYTVARPVLDLMQTMPALVYLIPAIAFFGTGSPPGIIATLIFGLPPVIRLTALGLEQVPETIREAARAYGASEWQLLIGVEMPLARASIMAGVNQTILMCLSMVVIAALIGAQGLGSVVLEALQFAATGQGILAGVAILLCAIVIDRLVQSAVHRPDSKERP